MLQSRKQRSITRVLLLAICALSIAACDLNTDPPPVSFLAIVSGNPQTVAAGAALPDPLVVIVADQFRGVVQGVTVTWAIAEGGGTLGTATSVSDVDGLAANTYTAGTTVGTSKITATVAGVGSVTFTVTVT